MKLLNGKLQDPGFGSRSIRGGRLLNPDGTFRVKRKGRSYFDAYMWMIHMAWPRFFLLLFIGYLLVNLIFATLFYLIGIENLTGVSQDPSAGAFFTAFFFSIQTFTTVGYGYLSPLTPMANWIASLDAFSGLLYMALSTGMFFARFAIPGPSIVFSDIAVICNFKEGKALMLRLANLHNNKIIDLDATMIMTYVDKEQQARKYQAIELQLKRVMMFPLNWTLVHAIDQNSPLFEMSPNDLSDLKVEFIVLVKGYDETYAQTISASRSYTFGEIEWDKRFKLMYEDEDDHIVLHLDRINNIEADPGN